MKKLSEFLRFIRKECERDGKDYGDALIEIGVLVVLLLATLTVGIWTSKPAPTVEAQTWPEAQTWVELGRQIKLHYPGKYDDVYDENIGLVVKATGATAICNDNTTSYSKTRSGTCSYHKGVKIWITAPPE